MAIKQENKLIRAHIKEVLSGKSSAYEQLYKTHTSRIYTFGLKFFNHNEQAAEELTKRVFIKAFEEIKTYPENVTFILWLKKLTVEEIRKGDIKKSEETTHQASIADQAIFALPDEERIVFILRDVDKLTIEESIEITKDSAHDINLKLENARKFVMEKLNADSLNDLDYKVNLVSQKSEPKQELWEIIYNEIHSIATKDLKEEAKGEVLNVGDAKETISEKFQKLKEEKKEKEVFLKPMGVTKTRRAVYIFLLVVLIATAVYYIFFVKPPQWEVVNLSGSPSIKENLKNIVVSKSSILEKDDLLYTDQNSKALIKIHDVGEIYVNPGSSIKRNGGDAQIVIISGDIDVVKKAGSESLPVGVFSAIVEDYEAGSYSIKISNNKAGIYSTGADLTITSGEREVYLIPQYMCEINQNGEVGIPYSLSASEEFINAVNDLSLQENNERLNRILLLSDKKDALTLFNILTMVGKSSRDIVINKLHSLVRLPKDVNPHQVANLDKGELKKWLKAIEVQN
ncbi:MAG: hypothetical protein A2V93_03585 [Ignavibacteria bacterium RBG_16_34_14]|nr:MAG: hypothetical protein A2V93_03585 [Ignavibacteria bacterium RBG_16_34_14]